MLETSMGFWSPTSGNIINHDDRPPTLGSVVACSWADAEVGVQKWAMKATALSKLKEMVRSKLSIVQRGLAESLREGNVFTASLV
jgi:hypothetical protein